MALANVHTVILGTIAFMVFWVLAVFPSFKLMPIGRTAGAVAGAVLMVVFQVLSPRQAYDAVDLSILGLLFGTMVVSLYLERADLFHYLGKALSWKSRGGKDLMCRVCILSAISSALFTNDTSCVVLTSFVLKLCKEKNLPPKPFLVALATSSNIGSSATPIGNPQNLVIAITSGISFGKFLIGLLPCMLLGITINTLLLLCAYWKQLSSIQHQKGVVSTHTNGHIKEKTAPSLKDVESLKSSDESHCDATAPNSFEHWPPLEASAKVLPPAFDHASANVLARAKSETIGRKGHGAAEFVAMHEMGALLKAKSARQSADTGVYGEPPTTLPLLPNPTKSPSIKEIVRNFSRRTQVSSVEGPVDDDEDKMMMTEVQKWRNVLWKCAVYFVTVGMLAALLYGLDLSWSALTAAVALMALDFQDAGPSLDKVMYQLLVFFAGMLITIDGFNATGVPETFWDAVEPYARINHVAGIAILAVVVIILSNIASNVPTVLLLGTRVSSSALRNGASVTRAWLMLAWTSTTAGNLTLVGSAANLIVSEQAMRAPVPCDFTFWDHLVFGLPSTLIVTAAGLPAIRG